MQGKNLPQEESSRILQFIDSILSPPEDFRHHVLLSLKQVFGYQRGTFFLIDNQGHMYAPVVLNIDDANCDIYSKYYYKEDIFQPQKVVKQALQKNVLTVTDIMPMQNFENTEYFNDFLQIQDIYHEVAMFLMEDTRPIGVIGLYRSEGERGFNAAELKTLQNVSAYIARTLAGNIQAADSQLHRDIIESSYRHLPIGFLIFDSSLNIHYINDAAVDFCRDFAASGTLKNPGKVFLEQFLSMDTGLQPGLKKTILSPSLKQFSVNILPTVYHRIKGMEYYTACIIPSDFTLKSYLDGDEDSQSVFSRRETEILNLVREGLDNREIAEKLFLSVHTVKTHLQNIYKKAGVKNRTSLCYKANTYYGNACHPRA